MKNAGRSFPSSFKKMRAVIAVNTGAIETSVYIYLAPVVTAVTSVIILHEKITFLSGLGILLVLGGLLLSEQKKKFFSIRGRKQTENVIE